LIECAPWRDRWRGKNDDPHCDRAPVDEVEQAHEAFGREAIPLLPAAAA